MSYNRFYFIFFEMFIMFINPILIFFFWNRQDKDAQLACITKRCDVDFIIQIQLLVLLVKLIKHFLLSFLFVKTTHK